MATNKNFIVKNGLEVGGVEVISASGEITNAAFPSGLTPAFSNLTLSGNLNFADNGKAIFGAGDDLQIYHDGSYSWIKDAGTGSLIVAATNLSLQNAATTKVYANFNDGGSSTIHYDGSPKLATTATGIDVTGTATATAVNTGAGAAGRNAFSSGDIRVAAPNDTNISLMTVSNTLATIKTDFYGGGSLVPLVLQTGANTNQLYLDTAGNVGLGVTPSAWTGYQAMQFPYGGALAGYKGSAAPILQLSSNTYHVSGVGDKYVMSAAAANYQLNQGQHIWYTAPSGIVDAAQSFTERMRITSAGNLGIGTSLPADILHGHNGSGNDGTYLRLSGGGGLNESYGGWIRGYGVSGSGGYLELGVVDAGSKRTAMQVTAQGQILKFFTSTVERLQFDNNGNTVFNESGVDADFRVESDSNTHMLFVDAGNNSVGIGTNATGSTALVVQASAGAGAISIIGRAAGGVGTLSFYDDDGTSNVGYLQGRADDNQFRLWTTTTDTLSLGQNNIERLRIDALGNTIIVNGFLGNSYTTAATSAIWSVSQFSDNDSNTGGYVVITSSPNEWQPNLLKITGTSVGSGAETPTSGVWYVRVYTYNGTVGGISVLDSWTSGSISVSVTGTYISATSVRVNVIITTGSNRSVGNVEVLSYGGVTDSARTQ